MVDVSLKATTFRKAKAEGWVHMKPSTLTLIKENAISKGDVLSVAKVAGIMASKKTSDLIPLCHPIPVDKVSLELSIDENENAIHVISEASTNRDDNRVNDFSNIGLVINPGFVKKHKIDPKIVAEKQKIEILRCNCMFSIFRPAARGLKNDQTGAN